MFTFTIILLPLAIVFYYIKSENKSCLILIITGILTGALIAACKAFLSFSHRIIPYSFTENFLFFFLNETLFPMLILYAVFLIISRDTINFKINAFFPLEASFYAVYLPYIITSSPQAKSLFSIFIKPILFLSMLYTISLCLKIIFANKKPTVLKILILAFIIIVYLVLPAITETIWIMNLQAAIWILLSVVCVSIPLLILILTFIQEKRDTQHYQA